MKCWSRRARLRVGEARMPELSDEAKKEVRYFQGFRVEDAQQLEPPAPGLAKAEWTQGEPNPRFVVTSPLRQPWSHRRPPPRIDP
jgi:hypothetical protein